MRFFKRRIALVGLVAGIAFATSAGVAFAVFPNDSVTHYTGCLNTSASPGGTFVNVAQGETPSKPCGKGQVIAHLSGGDITNVQTASGSGLTGGTDNGAASLTLDSTGCSSGGLLKWNGSLWACGSDNNTSYSAGTGLDLTGTTFSVNSGYQLPQSCSSGQVAKSDGSGGWSCQNDDNTGLPHAYLLDVLAGGVQSDTSATPRTLGTLNLPAGTYTLVGKIHLKDADRDAKVGCSIPGVDDNGVFVHQFDTNYSSNIQGANLTLAGMVTLNQAGSIYFTCQTFDAGVDFNDLKLLATQVSG
jgi:hypothetical protein